MQKGFYLDTARCVGCFTCVTACKNWNDVEPKVSAKPGTQGPKWRRLISLETGAFPNASIIKVSLSCMHCSDAPCAAVCPVGAIEKRAEDGIVVVDRSKCIGCHYCFFACPFGVPEYGSDGKMQKCNYCLDRTEQGQDPICAAACPTQAIKAGTMEELAQYAKERAAKTLVGASRPSLLVTP